MGELTHLDEGGSPRMVDVTGKPVSRRTASATGLIRLCPETIALIAGGGVAKGNVLTTAELAGIQAAKQTPSLIPLCHTLILGQVLVDVELVDEGARVVSEVVCVGQTGAEMEALTAVGVALLTIYDMCKAVDKSMSIEGIRLVRKTKEEVAR